MRILIVEDEIDLCDTIAEGLQLDGYAVDSCYNGNDAYELLLSENYDLAVLDLNLPGMDGMDILKEVRRYNQEVKLLILSARSSVTDKVLGLDLGANDYLAKPFDFEELEARIRSLLRRSFTQVHTVLTFGGISLDTVGRTAFADAKEITLTRKELAILEYFLLNPQKVISQEELMEHVWNMEADSFSNAVRVHIASLRKKLKTTLSRDPIATKIGEGYILLIAVAASAGDSEEDRATAESILKEKGVTYVNIIPDTESDFYKTFIGDITGFPMTYIVDSDGNMIGAPLVGVVKNQEDALMKRLERIEK